MPDRTTHEQAAYDRGVADAKAAASWTVDGNTKREFIPAVLAMLEDGDPAAYDYLPREPNLSGEFADDLTPNRLADDIFGHGWCPDFYAPEGDDAARMAALCDAYEEGVSDTFAPECERVLRAAIED